MGVLGVEEPPHGKFQVETSPGAAPTWWRNSFSHSKFPSLFLCWCFPIFDGFSLKMTPAEDFFFFSLLSKWEKLFWEVRTGPSSPLLHGKGCAGNTLGRKRQEKSEVGVGDLGINPGG